jgi:hypothetical protein
MYLHDSRSAQFPAFRGASLPQPPESSRYANKKITKRTQDVIENKSTARKIEPEPSEKPQRGPATCSGREGIRRQPNQAGNFAISALPGGTYRLTADREAFSDPCSSVSSVAHWFFFVLRRSESNPGNGPELALVCFFLFSRNPLHFRRIFSNISMDFFHEEN